MAVLVAACEFAPAPPEAPLATSSAAPVAQPPAIAIDETWTVDGDTWTFSGRLDPRGAPTDVVLEIGYEIANPRAFERQVPVAQGVVDAGPISVDVDVPAERDTICVRFTATNQAGPGSSRPFCSSTDLPGASLVVASPSPS